MRVIILLKKIVALRKSVFRYHYWRILRSRARDELRFRFARSGLEVPSVRANKLRFPGEDSLFSRANKLHSSRSWRAPPGGESWSEKAWNPL